jgi:hypothetical protein
MMLMRLPQRVHDGQVVTQAWPEGPSLFVHGLPGSLGDLGALGSEVSLEPGAVLWKEGDPGDHVVLLLEGRTLRHLHPGAVAG